MTLPYGAAASASCTQMLGRRSEFDGAVMIRMLAQIRRAPQLDEELFFAHWRNVHGALVTRHAEAMGVVQYVQSRRIPSAPIAQFAAIRGWRAAPDGLAMLSWPNQAAMLAAGATDPAAAARAELASDEQTFAMPGGQCGMMAHAETVFDRTAGRGDTGGPPVKMVIEVWRRPDMSAQAFSERWRGAHADLARQVADAMGFVRYVQNHRAIDFPIDLAAARGWRASPDGMSELWWTSEEAMLEALSKPAAAEASALLQADEAAFVHAPLMSAFLATEHLVLDRET